MLKRHYKLIIAVLMFLPFVFFVDKIVFAYMQPKAAEAVKNGEDAQILYGAKCAMCHGTKGEGSAAYPKKIAGLTKEAALEKIKAHKQGVFGDVVQLKADTASLSDSEKEKIASFVATLK